MSVCSFNPWLRCTNCGRSSTNDGINLRVNLGWSSVLRFGGMEAVQGPVVVNTVKWGMVGAGAVPGSPHPASLCS